MTPSEDASAAETERDRVLTVVRRCVAESLALPATEVSIESRLMDDLGADSLDFVDIIFMLERELDIRVRETEFNFLTRLDFSSPEVMTGAHLTLPVIERLSHILPALRSVSGPAQVTPRQLFSLITIESICLVCRQALAGREPP